MQSSDSTGFGRRLPSHQLAFTLSGRIAGIELLWRRPCSIECKRGMGFAWTTARQDIKDY